MEGGIKWAGGGRSFVFPPMKKRGGVRKCFQCYPPQPILNDQSLNFEDLVLLSPSEIRRELYKLMTGISQGIDRCKVPVVGKNGKLNETIERSALWSIYIWCCIYWHIKDNVLGLRLQCFRVKTLWL